MTSVLDASALLAFLGAEPGGDTVSAAILLDTAMSAVNWAEALSTLVDRGQDPQDVADSLEALGILGPKLTVIPLIEEDAIRIAQLRPLTKPLGLSLGDRACLALGLRLGLPILTADSIWASLDLGVRVQAIR